VGYEVLGRFLPLCCHEECSLGLLFFLQPTQEDKFLCIPSEGGPNHIDRIANPSLISTTVHPMILLEMPNHRLDSSPSPHGPPKPRSPLFGMPFLPPSWNRQSLYPQTPGPSLFLCQSPAKTTIRADLWGNHSRVGLHDLQKRIQGLHIGHITLVLLMTRNQPILVDGQGNHGPELAIRITATSDSCKE
jgi:hypothetical protein